MRKAAVAGQGGFTLIELVMVIVILGILSAIALPKFIDLSSQASSAAANGVAGALSAGSATNFAARKAGSASAYVLNAPSPACTTTILGNLMQGGWPTGYTVAATTAGTDTCAAGAATISCTVTSPSNAQTAVATVYCAP